MRFLLALWLAVAGLAPAAAQVSFGFSSGPVSIGINVPVYPSLVQVPGYPVYYAPGVATNYFFYDGLYWVFQNDGWYQSQWYNGPWYPVSPDSVPLYVLRVPVRYYHRPPAYFHGWRADAAPRWDEHYGHGWAEHHRDWNHYDRAHAPRPAPLPNYQRNYAGNRYPHDAAQAAREHERAYHYQPRDPAAQQHYQQQREAARNAPPRQQRAPQAREQRGPQPQAREQRGPQPQVHEQQGHDQRGGHDERNDFRNDHGQNSGG